MRRETVYIPASNANLAAAAVAAAQEDAFHMSSDEESGAGGPLLDELPVSIGELNDAVPISTDDYERPANMSVLGFMKRLASNKIEDIFTHGGLVLLLIFYLLMGATVFHYLEAPNEILVKDREINTILALRDFFHENIWNLTHSANNVISKESFNAIGQEYFEQLVINIFSAYRNQFINERHLLNRTTEGDDLLWTYANSVFFATTVVTTIGYGNLVPATKVGRIVCICFALFGIPLLLITIAHLGKYLSKLLGYFYRRYHEFKLKLRRKPRRTARRHRSDTSSLDSSSSADGLGGGGGGLLLEDGSPSPSTADVSSSMKAGSMNLDEMPDNDTYDEEDEEESAASLRIPVIMVFFVLVAYTALGGLIFQRCENWPYFDAFYFCFITMTTVGFGDIVPSEQVYIFFTMAYIIFGLSLTTMCIDLAGTAYIRRIHYIGTKAEDAKGALITGIQIGKHTGIEVFKTASGKLIQVRGAVLSSKEAHKMGLEYILQDMQYQQKNILYEPLSPAVQKIIKDTNIKILPDDITQQDGLVVQNRSYDKPTLKEFMVLNTSPNVIYRFMRPASRRRKSNAAVLVPFVLKESDI